MGRCCPQEEGRRKRGGFKETIAVEAYNQDRSIHRYGGRSDSAARVGAARVRAAR